MLNSARELRRKSSLRSYTSAPGMAYVSPYYLAMIHTALGEQQQALAALDQGYAERDRYLRGSMWMTPSTRYARSPTSRTCCAASGFPPRGFARQLFPGLSSPSGVSGSVRLYIRYVKNADSCEYVPKSCTTTASAGSFRPRISALVRRTLNWSLHSYRFLT